jgi:ribosomal protein S14
MCDSQKIESLMFFCDLNKCKLLIKACILRQHYSKNKPRENPLCSSGYNNTDYSKCRNCIQGKEILNDNKEILKEIEKNNINLITKNKKGRPIKQIYKCKECGEIDETKFREKHYKLCRICFNENQRNYYKEHKK